MFENEQPEVTRRWTQEDVIARGVRTVLELCVPAGGIIAEFLTEFIPGQRLDQLHDFVEQLNERITGFEEQFRARLNESAAYAALAEQATAAAVRSASSQRRKDLAEMLKTGLGLADADIIEHQAILGLLQALNDAQVIILMAYGSFERTMDNPNLDAFIKSHPGVFVEPPMHGCDESVERKWAMHQFYEGQLESLGLLKDTEGTIKSSPHSRRLEVTRLGIMLLSAIGREVRLS